MHLRVPCAAAVLRDDGASMMLASTIVPSAQPMAALRRQVRIDLLEQTLAQAVLLTDAGSSGVVVSSGSASVRRSPTKRLTDSTS